MDSAKDNMLALASAFYKKEALEPVSRGLTAKLNPAAGPGEARSGAVWRRTRTAGARRCGV